LTAQNLDAEESDLGQGIARLFASSSPKAKLVLRGGRDSTVRAPLTEDDFQEHVAGGARFGAIPFIDEHRVGWGCIDLDVRNWGHDPDDREVFEIINGIVERLAGYEITGCLERSKGKGWHIWTFFEAPVEAADVRSLLRHVALEAGARDEADLVCPRSDRADVGNGMWLPLFGGDVEPATRFYECDADTLDWVEAPDQARFVRELPAQSTSARALAAAVAAIRPTSVAPFLHAPEEPLSSWILEELREHAIKLDGLVELPDGRLNFRCPLHASPAPRAQGGSAVFFPTGNGHCSSSKCVKTWRSVGEFVRLVREAEANEKGGLPDGDGPMRALLRGFSAAQIFDPSGRVLSIPARDWAIPHLLPLGVHGLIVGFGGSGRASHKSRSHTTLPSASRSRPSAGRTRAPPNRSRSRWGPGAVSFSSAKRTTSLR
jgi:hypothetical protein